MPELPEVETVVRDVRPWLIGRRIVTLTVGTRSLRRPWQPQWTAAVVGTRVIALRRRAKWILVDLDTGARLVIHLGMSGQLTTADADVPLSDHTHFVCDLDDARQLRFRDVRRFGSVELFADEEAVAAFLAARVGPEPEELHASTFHEAIRASSRTIKAILLDQRIAAGVGNIYADEALHRAGVHPQRRGDTLTFTETERLRAAIAAVMAFAITHRGSSIRDYVGGAGQRGAFQNEFRVYGRTGEPCKACGTPIMMLRVAGRASHFCPRCQENPK
ncbi:MAG: bifunctional DNA-formamidopyrimidine glycosylase/DNA-(apurinic or apyrimidinic site) lyase [Bacteroidales bacterium]|nr:bifunctional DNA-formamidopyrimidine glycosylase/DNA-(apurinic or apyrimidinic site) lyase [Bacteroidales bacterium]